MKTTVHLRLFGALFCGYALFVSTATATGPPPPPEPGKIGDTVFCDENENGIQEAGEPGIPGVSVHLICSSSIWPDTLTPALVKVSDPDAVELGVKFQSDVDGCVTGVRFYKGPENTGEHVGNLWDNAGNLLATVTFTGETASGWQQANFAAPVAILANTTYVVSYYAPNGCYSADLDYFSQVEDGGFQNGPLRALKNGADGPNGVYAYGPGGIFPTNSFVASNYWVDVVFEPKNVSSMATDANGKYCFEVPGGATCTVWIDPATAPPWCNRVIPECPTILEGITVAPGESYLDADFCLAPPPPPGGEGCSPGYWRNHLEDWPPTGLSPDDDFDSTFSVDFFDPDITLDRAVRLGGGGIRKVARHGTAALLNALHPDVDFPYSVIEVIAFVQAGDVDSLVEANELGCEIP